ncbi:MAG: hypothetical protein KHX10_01060 [Clostridium sp.]|nr:hypothetical protein [Clostridium sp.]
MKNRDLIYVGQKIRVK